MRIALFSDIHGNPLALEAVLADIAVRGVVDATWVLGDLAALGPRPVEVLSRLAGLPALTCVRGNTDRYVASGDRPPPTPEEVRANPDLLARALEVAGSFAWTQGAVTAAGWLPWLRSLPLERTLRLPDGSLLLGVHASPGRDDSAGLSPEMPDEEIAARLQGCTADIICTGHTHIPFDRQVGRWRVVNVGSVSNPTTADRRACYCILTASPAGYEFTHYRVDYDRGAVVRDLEAMGHPGIGFIRRYLEGPLAV
jgi:predicted phosphodiesterase